MKISRSRGFDPVDLYSQQAKKADRANRTGEAKPDEVEISDKGKAIDVYKRQHLTNVCIGMASPLL